MINLIVVAQVTFDALARMGRNSATWWWTEAGVKVYGETERFARSSAICFGWTTSRYKTTGCSRGVLIPLPDRNLEAVGQSSGGGILMKSKGFPISREALLYCQRVIHHCLSLTYISAAWKIFKRQLKKSDLCGRLESRNRSTIHSLSARSDVAL
jgi:hypothetical protein